jgi:hypothetical protein
VTKCTLPFRSWHLRLFPYINSPRLNAAVNNGLWISIYVVMVLGSMHAFFAVFRALEVITKVSPRV